MESATVPPRHEVEWSNASAVSCIAVFLLGDHRGIFCMTFGFPAWLLDFLRDPRDCFSVFFLLFFWCLFLFQFLSPTSLQDGPQVPPKPPNPPKIDPKWVPKSTQNPSKFKFHEKSKNLPQEPPRTPQNNDFWWFWDELSIRYSDMFSKYSVFC